MERAIESVLKGGKDIEVIIVNDGSKDGTEAMTGWMKKRF